MCVCGKGVSLSQAVVVDRTVYISGQLGLDVASGQLVDGGVQAQARQVMAMMMVMMKVEAEHFSCLSFRLSSTWGRS